MKVFGGYHGKRAHSKKGSQAKTAAKSAEKKRSTAEQNEIDQIIADYQRVKKRRRIIAASVLAVLLLGGSLLYQSAVKPPDVSVPTAKPAPEGGVTGPSADPLAAETTAKPAPEATPAPRQRREDVFTFLLVGMDQSFGNTDTIMLCYLDTTAKKLNVLSIPRDTCANVESNESLNETKKINAVYARAGIEGLQAAVADFIGCPIDSYVTVSLRAFVSLVDTIGGVTFNVPYYMDYDDPTQNLHIHFNKGEQFLGGSEAVKVVRWRQNNDGTSYGDIARIETQQAFLKTVIKKCLSLSNLTSNLDDYVRIFNDNVKTDMTTGNMLWYAQQALKLSMEDISFYTLPSNYNDSVKGFAYGMTKVDEWLELLNASFNVYDQPLTVEDIDVISRDKNGNLYATGGVVKGGMDSFLDYSDYLVRLREWNKYLAEQKAREEAAAAAAAAESGGAAQPAGAEAPAEQPEAAGQTTDMAAEGPGDGAASADMNGG